MQNRLFYQFQCKRSSMKTLEQDSMICASRENATRMYFIYYELFALHFCTNLARQIVVKLFWKLSVFLWIRSCNLQKLKAIYFCDFLWFLFNLKVLFFSFYWKKLFSFQFLNLINVESYIQLEKSSSPKPRFYLLDDCRWNVCWNKLL